MENRKALGVEAARLGLRPAACIDILIDTYRRLETKKKTGRAGVPLGMVFTNSDDEHPVPPMPEVFDTGRATAECCLFADMRCYVMVTRASRTHMASGPFDSMELASSIVCFFADRSRGVSAFLLDGSTWVPFRDQLGPKARKGCCRLFEVMMKIAVRAEKSQTDGKTPEPAKNQWTTKDAKQGV